MSESDDTDVLLLIPPDLFTVASSGSSDSLENVDCSTTNNNTVVTNIIEHVQYLEDKINSMEMMRNENNDYSFIKPLLFNNSNHKYENTHNTSVSLLSSSSSCRINKSPSSSFKKKYQGNLSPIKNHQTSTIDKKINGYLSTPPLSSSSSSGAIEAPSNDIIINSVKMSSDDEKSSKVLDLKQSTVAVASNGSNVKKTLLFNENDDYSLYLKNNNQENIFDLLRDNNYENKQDNNNNNNNNNDLNYLLTSQDNKVKQQSTSSSSSLQFNKSSEIFDQERWKSKKFTSLADFWGEPDKNKSEIEKLRIKLEEEKFRREHCEKLIQELQKKLLEQQEKVAVAIAIDKEKIIIISQYQVMINKLKDEYLIINNKYEKLQNTYDVDVSKYKTQINHYEMENLNLKNTSNQYKDKCDYLQQQNNILIDEHKCQLENSQKIITTTNENYELLKNNHLKLQETSSNYEKELKMEKLKFTEIHKEMDIINKALETCESELSLLRQENENLQLRFKEEKDRCTILDKKKTDLLEELNNMRKCEIDMKNQVKLLISQNDKKRNELRDIYQKQVDDVVQVKLQEFQSQLDSAEMTFKNEIETKQRVIAECAARKIKSIIDKHQLEIHLIEEKHREEKRLHDIKVSKSLNKITMLESKLNDQEAAKSRIAQQLHGLMEKQWKQALQIISPVVNNNNNKYCKNTSYVCGDGHDDDDDNNNYYSEPVKLHRNHSGQKHSSKNTNNNNNNNNNNNHKNKNNYIQQKHEEEEEKEEEESLVAFTSTDHSPESKLIDSKEDLKKCIQMILQMQDNKPFETENESFTSPVSSRQVPRKYYTKADSQDSQQQQQQQQQQSVTFGKNVSWEPIEADSSIADTSIIHFDIKSTKPPWK